MDEINRKINECIEAFNADHTYREFRPTRFHLGQSEPWPKWEYATRPHPGAGLVDNVLAGLGADGWELVAVADQTLYFKRQVRG